MYERQVQGAELGITRLLFLFAALAVAFLVVLAIAPAKSRLTEWRAAQERYNELASNRGAPSVPIEIQQIWLPKMHVVDRCTSCHVAMGDAEPIAGEPLFAAHATLPHEPRELGCTVCHGGQGRATKREAAHGRVKHWDEPMLDREHFEAGCGRCHTHFFVASPTLVDRGRDLVARYDCIACHRIDGRGRGSGPDLSFAGARGYDDGWHERHLALAERGEPGWKQSYGAIAEVDRRAIERYLDTRNGAPRLLEAKILAHELGCRGCHKINGVGGDDGPDLTYVGAKLERDLDFARIEGPKTLPSWLFEHFLAPDRVVPKSAMPALGLSEEQARLLTLYMLSLRPAEVPQEQWPKDRIRGIRFHERDFADDGGTLYGVFCAACHGKNGEGRRLPSGEVFPAIGNRDFLAVADDAFLEKTINFGRPGRRMPAWGVKDGGLTPSEIGAIVKHVRSFAPDTPEPFDEIIPAGDPARGAPIFAASCAGCHGSIGEGVTAPQLRNPAFLAAADDRFLVRTILRGRVGSGMRHFGLPSVSFPALTIEDAANVAAFIRTFGKEQP